MITMKGCQAHKKLCNKPKQTNKPMSQNINMNCIFHREVVHSNNN